MYKYMLAEIKTTNKGLDGPLLLNILSYLVEFCCDKYPALNLNIISKVQEQIFPIMCKIFKIRNILQEQAEHQLMAIFPEKMFLIFPSYGHAIISFDFVQKIKRG